MSSLPKNNGIVVRHTLATDMRVGAFLGVRQLRRANRWTTALIIFIMTLTFLNLVVISGILVGLIEGGNRANRNQYTGDVIITTRSGENAISDTDSILKTIAIIPGIEKISTRYLESVRIEANYKTRRDFSALADTVGTQLAGVKPSEENALSGIKQYVVEGEFLDENESGYIVLGANLLRRYSSSFGDGFDSLDEVYPGDEVKVTVGEATQRFIVKGITDTKVNEVSLRAFVTKDDFLRLIPRPSLDANEIAMVIDTEVLSSARAKNILVRSGFDSAGKIQTATEAIPEFLDQIRIAFGLLGNVIGAIGIAVASITIFIVIFINAVTRQKYIGILKAIGITPRSIKIAYVIQSLFYAAVGSTLGIIIIYVLLVPFFLAHPLDFPFSDGILVAPWSGTLVRFVLLMIVTFVAGLLPAAMIVRRNTLASILGR